MKKYRYYLGQKLVCSSNAKVEFTGDFPAIREETEESKKDSSEDKTDANKEAK